MRVKLGIDVTAPHIHIGNGIPLQRMRAFQDAGHTGVLIVGDYTARIGDPSGASAERPLIYMAIPPSAFADAVTGFSRANCVAQARVALEKPFGRDLASARALDQTLHKVFPESSIFRRASPSSHRGRFGCACLRQSPQAWWKRLFFEDMRLNGSSFLLGVMPGQERSHS